MAMAAVKRALLPHLRVPVAPPAASAATAVAVSAPAALRLLSSTTEAKGEVADRVVKNFQKVEPAKHSPLSGFLNNAMGKRDSSNQDRLLEENKEFQQFRQEFRPKMQFNVHNTYHGGTMFQTAGGEKSSISGGSPPFMGSRTFNDKKQFARKTKKDFVHVLLKGNKTFVTVTDAQGNKKTGASAGCLEDRKGRSRLSRYAAEATAEQVGRSARKMGLKSVVMKVKGFSFFKKKKKVILGFREGFRGERITDQSPIMLIHDVTQLPHNGCRLPKQRRT